MSRKFLSVLLTVALVLCFMPVAGASSNLNIVDIDILDKMDDIHSALSEASKRGVYEDTYGGLYYDNGRIILLTTNASRGTDSSVAAYKNDSDISIVSCDYTFGISLSRTLRLFRSLFLLVFPRKRTELPLLSRTRHCLIPIS